MTSWGVILTICIRTSTERNLSLKVRFIFDKKEPFRLKYGSGRSYNHLKASMNELDNSFYLFHGMQNMYETLQLQTKRKENGSYVSDNVDLV